MSPGIANRSRPHLLLVGTARVSRALHQILQRHYDISEADGWEAALAEIRVRRPDLLLAMPAEMEAPPLPREDPELQDIPLVLLSADPEPGEAASSLGLDFDDYIDPSVTEAELVARIKASLNAARLRRKRNERYRFLIELDDALRALFSPDEITLTAATSLGRHLGVNRCAYADVEADQDIFNLTGNFSDGVPSIVGRYRLEQFGAECLRLMRAGLPYVVADSETDARTAAVRDAYRDTRIRAIICVPLMKGGRLVAAMAVHQATPRNWRADETELLIAVASRCWESIERTRITRELHDNELRYRSLVETISAVVWHTDGDGFIGADNPSWAAFTGQTFEQYKGWGWADAIHPDDRDAVASAWRAATASQDTFESAYRLRRRDGEYRHMTVHGTQLLTLAGEREWIGSCVDVTETLRTEQSMRETAARLQFTLESAQIGDWELDLVNGTTRRSLRHDQCFGYMEPVADWNFEKFLAHVHPDDREMVERAFLVATTELKDWRFESRVVWPDTSVHWIAAHGSIYEQVDGKPVHMLGIVYDITERKQAEERLREADRRKDEFLAMLAHELRNPLAPIGAAADLLSLVRTEDQRIKQTSAVISRQVRHMTSLVDDLLDVSRVTRGLVKLDKTVLDAKRIVADAAEQVRPLIEARHHHLEAHLPPEPAFVLGDQKRLVQVMTNLLNNAAKYTPEGGRIVLRLEVQGEHVMLSVDDNGIGMPPELVKRAFDLFAQAARTSDRGQGGLGLGLALVKSLVELHGGSVTARSAGSGAGSSFTVCLPRVFKSEVSTPGRNAPAIEIPSRKLRVLVVDDNADGAAMLATFLEAAGHELMVEHHPRKALERVRVDVPDVCLLDIGLPDMDGNELARRLRANPETAKSTLIAITGYGQEQDRKAAAAAGFDHHFVKPVDTAKLTALLSDISDT